MTKISQTETPKAMGEKPDKNMEKTSATTHNPKKLSPEELRLLQEKPILGAGNNSYMTPSLGAIKKAKNVIQCDKKKDKKISKVLENAKKLDTVCEVNQRSIVEAYESQYTQEEREENIMNQDENNDNISKSPRLLKRRASVSPDECMGEDDFQSPKRFTAWSELIKAKARQTFILDTSNKYDSLSSDSAEEEGAISSKGNSMDNNKKKILTKKRPRKNKSQDKRQSNPNEPRQKQSQTTTSLGKNGQSDGRKNKSPPVVLKGELKKLDEVKKRLKEECNISNVSFKYTRFNTLIFVENDKEHDKLVEYFKQEQVDAVNKNKIEFHTYTTAPKKTHAFVIRGLDFEPETDDIKSAFLQEYDIEISSVYQMHTKYRPLYMIVTSSAITQKYLVNTVKYLMSVRVFIEERQNVRRIIQCHRCQEWGHATSNCFRAPMCLKCAEKHHTKECTKDKDSDPKCCNCGGKHPANSITCRVYQMKLVDLESKSGPVKKTYVPAPPPDENAWRGRAGTHKNKEELVPQRVTENEGQEAAGGGPPQLVSVHKRSSNDNAKNMVEEVTNSVKIVQELNKKVNFKELNRALNDLNSNMRNVKTGVEAFQVYYQFIENLESNYNILN